MIASLTSPHRLFAAVASIVGLMLIAMIPPLGGGNETLNFQRVATVAAGYGLVGKAQVPSGIVEFLKRGDEQFPSGAQAPFGYSRQQFRHLAEVPLNSAQAGTLAPNPIAVLHPLCYLPQLAVYKIAEWFEARPITLFMLSRLAGLIAGIALTAIAIARMPFHGWTLAALALLPTMMFGRSTVDADPFTNGLAFLFGATVLREMTGTGPIRSHRVYELAGMSFVLAQCKSAYLFLPLMMAAIPAARFASRGHRFGVLTAAVVPGAIASFAYMLALKFTYFAGIRYVTWAGEVAPDAQTAAILADPLGYVVVLLRSVFTTDLLPTTVLGFIGIFGPPVYMFFLFYPLIILTLLGVVLADPQRRGEIAGTTQLLFAGLCAVSTLIVLTLLYLQWTGLGGRVILGFQGRYLYPLLPMLIAFVPTRQLALLGWEVRPWFMAHAVLCSSAVLWTTWATYLMKP